MVTTVTLAGVLLHLISGQLSLPFRNYNVDGIAFDGQPLTLFMDSGIRGTYVIYKDWYEKTYGSCPPKICYTCEGGCDPYTKKGRVTRFEDGSAIRSVAHQGNVDILGYKLEMEFQLIIGYSPGPVSPRPNNFLGLGYPTEKIRVTLPSELLKRGIIAENTVSICAPGLPTEFSGKLIPGLTTAGQCATTSPKTVVEMDSSSEHFNTKLSSIGLVSEGSEVFGLRIPQGIAIYDTGTTAILLPKAIFEHMLNRMTSIVSEIIHQDVWVKTVNDIWYIDEKGYDFLPTLAFEVKDSKVHSTIFIEPSHYTRSCAAGWCELLLDHFDEPAIVFGIPFFTSYFSSFRETGTGQRTVEIAPYVA